MFWSKRTGLVAAAVAAALSGAIPALAATVTETFTFDPLDGYGSETGSAFAPFDPALGTLNSVSYDVAATATFSGGAALDLNRVIYELTFIGVDGATPLLTNQTMQAAILGDGAATASLTITDTFIATFTAPSVISVDLAMVNLSTGVASILSTFPTESVTYNYTPATPVMPVPEPRSIALLAMGLAGMSWWGLRRRPLMAPLGQC